MVTPWIICGLVWFFGAVKLPELVAPAFYIGIVVAIIYAIVDIRCRGHAHYLLGNIAGFFMLMGCGLLALLTFCGLVNKSFH